MLAEIISEDLHLKGIHVGRGGRRKGGSLKEYGLPQHWLLETIICREMQDVFCKTVADLTFDCIKVHLRVCCVRENIGRVAQEEVSTVNRNQWYNEIAAGHTNSMFVATLDYSTRGLTYRKHNTVITTHEYITI